ncbi:MAG: exodeoxyribonuclease VII large subunit [Pseudomonadota bacterium]
MNKPPDSVRGSDEKRAALSVSELNRQARTLLERGLARLWVDGEISNLARPASGHIYFTLKDESAQIRCAWFRQRQQRGQARAVANGDQMLAFGRVSLYEPRGDYQLIVEQLEPAGEGELRRRFEQLKKKLDAEGLFDASLKREPPALPGRIGVITSPSGAAIRDILTVLRRRFANVPVVLYPAAVQGDAAVPELIAALQAAGRRAECDVLIIGRGGGSLEDLWAFNDEALARAIRQSPIPVISAVGHEVDVSIADLVADVRAPTPSGAAELAVPDAGDWQRALAVSSQRLLSQMRRTLEDKAQALDWLARRLAAASPAGQLQRQRQQLDASTRALKTAMQADLIKRRRRLENLSSQLTQRSPAARLQRLKHRHHELNGRLTRAGEARLARLGSRLALAARGLDAVSPLATLERGYAIVSDGKGRVITDLAHVQIGDAIGARLASGRISATVDRVDASTEDDA